MLHTRFTSQGRRRPSHMRPQQCGALFAAVLLSGGFLFALFRYMVVWDVHAAVQSSPSPSPSATPVVLSSPPSVSPAPTVLVAEAATPTPSPTPIPEPVLLSDAENGLWSYSCAEYQLEIERTQPLDNVVATVAVLSDYASGTVTSAFAEGQYGLNVRARTSDIAQSAGVLFAINGDYCGYRSDGIIVRGGEVYRNKPARCMMAIYSDGRMELVEESEADLDAMLADGLQDTYSFGPVLVEDGQVPERISTDVPSDNPRTAVGQREDGSFVFVVVDGRQSASEGMDIHELAEYMLSLGCVNAYNLDGGMTSCMYFNGEVISSPCGTAGRERTVSDILCIYPSAQES